jgi:flagellar assembly protein FliH
MSSKVLLPEDGHTAAPVAWREVKAPAGKDASPARSAPAEAAAQLAELERRAEQRAKEAYTAGLREGEAAGRKQGAAELQPAIERAARAIEELAQFRPRLRREAEADMLKLALAVARRILRRELAVDPEAMHGLVLAALEKLEGQEISRVRIHPAYVPMVSGFLRQRAGGERIEVISDPSREPGALIFETQRGNLDASVESQLQEIERGLADCLRRHS